MIQADFSTIAEGRYRLEAADVGVVLEADRLRRRFDELHAELTVRSDGQGARIVGFDGTLSAGVLNLSSIRARQERAAWLAKRDARPDVDWPGLLEALCLRVIHAERAGEPSVVLRDVPRPAPDQEHDAAGFRLLKAHPTILFADGGAAKSMLAEYWAGLLEHAGVRVLFADWELDGATHRERLERLFPGDMPALRYVRCSGPLTAEADRIGRIIAEHKIGYLIVDSIAPACDGKPEDAEVAGRFFRALRPFKIGSLLLAHVNRSDNGADRPFGSTFWHNLARSVWFGKKSEEAGDGQAITVGLFHRKANTGPLRPALGYTIRFDADRTRIDRTDLADAGADLSGRVPLWQRAVAALRNGPLTVAVLAYELDARVDSVDRIVRRSNRTFIKAEGADGVVRVSLLELSTPDKPVRTSPGQAHSVRTDNPPPYRGVVRRPLSGSQASDERGDDAIF